MAARPCDAYPVCCETWTAEVTEASNAAARLVEAVQRCDITREEIAHAVVRLEPQFRQLADQFLRPSAERQTVHKCVRRDTNRPGCDTCS